MNRILLLTDNAATRDQLEDWLAAQYRVILPAGDEGLPEAPFDLCILGDDALPRHADALQQRKAAARPLLLPALLVAPRARRDALPAHWQAGVVDEVIFEPILRAELHLRVQGLLERRRLSAAVESGQEVITRINKAIESTSDGVSIADVHGTALYNNPAFIERYGYTVNDLNLGGIPETLFVDPDVARAIFQAVQRGESWNGEVRLKTRHGAHVSTLVRADRIADNTGTPIGIISVYSDITELKRAQAAERAQRVMAEALRDISTALTSTLDLGEVLDRILDNVGRVVPHDAASVIMIDDNGRARFVRSRSYTDHAPETAFPAVEFAVADYAALRWMAENEQPLVIEDVRGDPTWGRLPTPHRRAYVGAPIHLRRKVIGFLSLHSSTPGYFGPTHAERLQAFAGLAAIALQNALFYDQAQELAALEERQRLARNLHDAVSQMLFSASVIAEALPHLWERDPERVRPQLAELHKLTRGALAEMRMLLMELRPTALQEAELNELLQQLTDALAGSSRLAVSLTVEGASTPPPEVRVALYYIAQEALNNVIKHAHAKAVTVHLQRRPDVVRLRIADDGRGFDVEHAPSMSLGLGIMRERADAVGASLQLTSAPGAGAQVEVVWSDRHGKEPT